MLAVLALTASVALSAPARQPMAIQLLRAYAPTLVLHPSERFHPESVDGFLADSDLVGSHYDQRLCRAVDGPAALDCYATADAAHALPAAVYGAHFTIGQRVVLEYWLFYPFDLFQIAGTPPLDQFWQDHEGDWEAVAVVLDRGAPKPLSWRRAGIARGARRDWARSQRRGTHPVVYVALGSHANYFSARRDGARAKLLAAVALVDLHAYKVRFVTTSRAGRH